MGTGAGSINHPSPIKLVHWLEKVMPILPQTRTQFPDAESVGTRGGEGAAIRAQNKDPDSSPFGETNQGAPWMVKMLPLLAQGETY